MAQTTQSLDVNGVSRQYLLISPSTTSSAVVPIIVVLGGIQASVQEELQRDGLLPLAQAGAAELVYPVGIDESWNAGGCCGTAAADGVDDTTFLEDLVATVDPGHADPIYLVGYSNGGRLAYTLACAAPSIADGYAIVKAVPLNPCVSQAPITIIQIASTDDWEVPYEPGDSGDVSPPVTQQVALLQQSDGCAAASTTTATGSLTYVTWPECAQGTRLALATYSGGSHLWPAGDGATPDAASVIERFFGIT
jgi:polyhydroxybutyrate depolymerase